jgi:hypothetical protein
LSTPAWSATAATNTSVISGRPVSACTRRTCSFWAKINPRTSSNCALGSSRLFDPSDSPTHVPSIRSTESAIGSDRIQLVPSRHWNPSPHRRWSSTIPYAV